jgi:hypothetical protein
LLARLGVVLHGSLWQLVWNLAVVSGSNSSSSNRAPVLWQSSTQGSRQSSP